MNKATLHWGDPRLLAAQLIDDERAVFLRVVPKLSLGTN